jgi:2-polyprenyl-3-methyl-5-hydroxy-6-metoxy-1,4-benzoquinol methylase
MSGLDMTAAEHAPAAGAAVAEACAWCGASLPDGGARGGRERTRRAACPRCGVLTTSPWPDPETLDEAYRGAYRPASGRFAGPGDRLLAFSRTRLARRMDRLAPPGGVLDVGAGEGLLVEALRRRGRHALGLERPEGALDRPPPGGSPDATAAAPAQAPHALVSTVPLSELDGPWAAIVFWHSLEHMPRPTAALRDACALLAPGGLLAIAVPNAASLQSQLFGERWLHSDLPRHLTHIAAPALVHELETLGLRVRRVSHWRGGQLVIGWLHGLVRALPGHPSLYDALRRPEARWQTMGPLRRSSTLLLATALCPLAALLALAEVALRRGGTVYVEARAA